MAAIRPATLGLVLGAIAAVTYHFTVTAQATGWFAYAPLSESIDHDTHPGWWPTAVIGPLLGALLGFGFGRLQERRRSA
jgi:heme/copper-type cytochrome/quinol oxidase subunit 1